jgi:signal transduction histidine kinase
MDGTNEIKSIFFIGTFLMLFLAIGLLFLVLFYQRNLAKIKTKESELLLKTAIASERKERKRIAQELHDGLQSDLNALRNYVVLLGKKTLDTQASDLLNSIKSALDQTLENTRLITYKLMPPLLETAGFGSAVQEYLEQLRRSTAVQFYFENEIPYKYIPTDQEYDLFRILQEITQNMLKHNQVTECILRVYLANNGIQMELQDNGFPFDFYAQKKQSAGLGLQTIQSRLQSLSATLTQKVAPHGNHLIIFIPIAHD